MRNNPLVSIIITTRNEEDVIETLLLSIKKQTYQNIEIILVDNKSTDNTLKISKRFTEKVFTKGPERSTQRNFGAMKAKGDYLLFLDADMELTKNVIEACVSVVEKRYGVAGVIIPEKSVGKRFWERVKSFERSFYFDEGSFLTDAARFFNKNAFLAVGKYDESITGTEDWDLSESMRKKGYTITWIKSYLCHHERIPSLWKHAKKFYYYGIDSSRTLKKQNQGLISAKTIHFLRPTFYKNWKRLISHPILTSAMNIMLFSQMFFGGLGFLKGKIIK